MHLALVAPGYPRDGDDPFAPYWPALVRALLASGAYRRISIFALRYPACRGPYEHAGASVYGTGLGDLRLRQSPVLWRDALRRVMAVHRRAPIDVIHALTLNEAGFVGALAAKRLSLPVAAHLHGGELTAIPAIAYGSQLRWNERLQVAITRRAASTLTGGSHQGVRRLGTRASWAPLGVDTDQFRPSWLPASPAETNARSDRNYRDRFHLLHVADLNPVKDQRTLLAAFRRVLDTEPRATLSVVGGGREAASLRRQAQSLRVADQVLWLGRRPNRRLLPFYAAASLYVATSLHESQGLALLEAAACGLPVVSTPVGAAPDLNSLGVTTVAAGDPIATAEAVQDWQSATELQRRQAGEANRDAVCQRFAWPVCAERWIAVHRALAG